MLSPLLPQNHNAAEPDRTMNRTFRPVQMYLAETVGTFALVFAGTGAIVINDISGGTVTHVGVALTFGLIVTAMIYATGEVSGAHINPAVTLGFLITGRFSVRHVLPYIIAQLAGAVFASLLLSQMFPEHTGLGATIPAGTAMQSFVLETVLTFILMFVILCTATGAKEKGIMAGAAIGGTVALEAMFAGPISGASMNPARSFGPAFASASYTDLWIYLAAPVLGAILATAVFRILYSPVENH